MSTTQALRASDAVDRLIGSLAALRALAGLVHPTHVGPLDFTLVARQDLACLLDIVADDFQRGLETAREASDELLRS